MHSWGRAWEHVIPLFAFPPDVRPIYTTNLIESLHMQLRKIIKNRGHFLNDEAPIKLLWLALRSINDGKVRSAREDNDEPARRAVRRPLRQSREVQDFPRKRAPTVLICARLL